MAYREKLHFPRCREKWAYKANNLFGLTKIADAFSPPPFMTDKDDQSSLDNVVRWMLAPQRKRRPTAQQLLALPPLCWIAAHRRAPAMVCYC